MEVSQLLSIIRIKFADPLLDNSDEGCLFKTDELIYYINNALREATLRGKLLVKGTFSVNLLTGTNTYSVPRTMITVDEVLDENKSKLDKLQEADLNSRLYYGSNEWRTDVRDLPVAFIQNSTNNTLMFWPIPSKDSTITLRGTYFVDDLDSTDDIPIALSELYQRDLIYWVLYEGYSKQDADTYEPGEAEINKRRFTEIFGEKPTGEEFQEILNYPDDPGSLRDY